MGPLRYLWNKGVDESMLKIKKTITENNDYIDFISGDIKSDALNSLIDKALISAGECLSIRKLPEFKNIEDKFKNPVYLSKEKSNELAESLELSYKALDYTSMEGVKSILSAYRIDSLALIKKLQNELEVYIDTFGILSSGGKVKNFFRKVFRNYNLTYKDILITKKRMSDSLSRMLNIVNDNVISEFTYDNIMNKLASNLYDKIKTYLQEQGSDILTRKAMEKYIAFLKDFHSKHSGSKAFHNLIKILNGTEELDLIKAQSELAKLVTAGVITSVDQKKIFKTLKYSNGLDLKRIISLHCLLPNGIESTTGYRLLEAHIKEKMDKAMQSFVFEKKITISRPLLGDVLKKLRECFKYTKKELHKVLGVGDIENVATSIDFRKLIGSYYDPKIIDSKHKTNIERTKNLSIKQKEFENIKSKVKKSYDEIKNFRQKLALSDNEASNIKVENNKISETGITTLKACHDDLETRYNNLGTIATSAQNEFRNEDKRNNYYILYYRKGNKFLKICEGLMKNLKILENKRKEHAKKLISDVEQHYSEKKKAFKKDKSKLQSLQAEYKKIPTNVSKFLEGYNNNKSNVETFLSKI